MFDTPLAMDDVLIADRRARNIMQRSITPIVVSAIFRALWSNSMGVVTRAPNPSGEFNCYYSTIFTLPRNSYRILVTVKYYLETFL